MRALIMGLAVITAAVAGFAGTPAFAQGLAGTKQEQQACSRDASRFCRKDLGNDGAVQSCLTANRAKLSSSCRKVFESHGM